MIPFNPDDIVVFTLQVNEAPIVGFSPDSLHFTLDPTGVAFPVLDSSQITITNTGLGPLNWATGSAAPELMYYKFDEVGTAQTQNHADPTSPVPATAQVLGLTMGGTGYTGAALIGNGLTSTSNYVNPGWVTNFGTGSWTIEMWLNNVPSNTTLYYLWGDNTAGSFRCFLGGVAGAGNVILRRTGMTDVLVTGVAPGPSVVTFVYDASIPQMRAYLNGTLVNTVNQTAQNIVGTANFKVAGYSSSVGMSVGMLMDEFKMYNRAIDVTDASRQGWLTSSPQSGSIAPGGSQNVWVIADATGLIGGEYKGEVHIMSNDPVHPDTTLPVGLTVFGTPQIAVDPLTLTFDTLLVGASQTLPVTVSNTGSFPLNVTNVTTSNADFSAAPLTLTVGVGEADTINVTFNPSIAQLYTETMSIFSDDPVNPTVIVTLTGVANEAPAISISPDSLHFELFSGDKDSTQFTISNLGIGPLTYELTDEDLQITYITAKVDRSYLRPEYNVEIPKGDFDWRVGTPQTEGAGGPDIYGYKWIDSDEPGGPLPNYIDISSTGTLGVLTYGTMDDGRIDGVPLPFPVKFYGIEYNSITIVTNGFVGFNTDYTSSYLTNAQIPGTALPNNIIAAVWDDLNGNNANSHIYYQQIGNKFIIQFHNWNRYGNTGGNLNFQYIFQENTEKIELQYANMNFGSGTLNSYTVGIENSTGSDGLNVVFNAAYLHNNLALIFARESQWLSENPTSGIIAPGGSVNIWAIANSAGLLGGDYLAAVVVNNNDPINPQVKLPKVSMHVTGVPRVSVTPEQLVFDSCFVGATPQLDLLVENVGTDQLNVINIISSNSLFTTDTTNLSLPPFGSGIVTVTFAPIAPGSFNGELVFVTNDPITPNDTVSVSGVGLEAPLAVVSPSFQNPVLVPNGDSTTVFINLSNAGGSPLIWTAAPSNAPTSGKRKTHPVVAPFEKSEFAEYSPYAKSTNTLSIESIWDLQLSINLYTVSGANGNAGAEFDGTYYYTTRWGTALIHKYNLAGALVEEFSIPGVTGLRDLAFDGTYMYGGAAANTIYMMDFVTKTLIGTIPSPVAVRNIAYDSDNDAFWVGNWNTDLVLVNRSGVTLAVIPAANHGLIAMYGSAYDNWSTGGPYLWVFNQDNTVGGIPQNIHQISLTTFMPTGIIHDVTADFPAVTTPLAGGLFTAEGIIPGKVCIGGTLQGVPDMFFVYELAETAPDWIKVLVQGGTISPMDQFDIPIRIYQNATPGDTAYVNIFTNDPALPVTSVQVIRTMVTGLEGQTAVPTTFDISQNYPNPFNPTTSIKYQLPQTSDVRLLIYNVLGQKVRTLVNSQIEAGYHSVIWDGRNDEGVAVASGVYIYRFEAGDFTRSMKLMLLK